MIQIKRGAATVATVNPLSSSNMTKAVMGDEQITLVWEAPAFVPFYLGDYITFEGANWTLNKLPTVKKLSSKTWQYNAVFQSTKYELIKAMYLLFDNTDTLPSGEFPLTGTADTFMELLVANLNRVAGSAVWSVGQVIENTDYKNLTFSNEDCLSVLARLASEFDTEYHVNNHVIHLKKISTEREVALEYGSTLYDIERSSVDSSDVVTRLYPFGSTKNLASNYRGGNSPLRLPVANGNYIESNVNLYGIIEQSKTFDDIYPRLSSGGAGVVTGIGNYLEFTDSALDFNVNDYLLDVTKAKVHFNTGECAGYDFEIASYNHVTKTFVLIPNTQENDFTLPTDDLKPAVSDKYVLLDIIMPPLYLAAAEAELLTRAQEYMSQNSTPKVAYKTTFSAIYAKLNLQNVECGDSVTVYDADMGINEQIRIVKLTKGLTDFWTVQFDLSNTVTATRLERIEGNMAAVENTVIVTNQRVNRNNLRAYQNTKELREMVFDPDGYFDAENIKPLSIETSMLSVGAKSQSFQLSSLLQPNYAGNPQVLQWSAGLLTHFTIVDDAIKEWTISQGSITITGGNQTSALYIYARCNRAGSTGDIYLSPVALKFNEGSTYYYFLIGVLHTPINTVRGISLTYGQTTINGQFIKTGVISSIDGATYFNLNTGEIGGNIKFRSTSGALKTVEQAVDEVEVGGRNYVQNSEIERSGSWSWIVDSNQLIEGLNIGQKVIFSFDGKIDEAMVSEGRKGLAVLYTRRTGGAGYDVICSISFESTSYMRYKATGIISSNFDVANNRIYIDILSNPYQSGIGKYFVKKLKVAKGDKDDEWTPAPEDVQTQIDANKALLADIASDGKLTPNEKIQVKRELAAINAEYPQLVAQCPSEIDGILDGFADANYYLNEYLNPLLANMSETSTIVSSTFNTEFSNYYSSRAGYLSAISDFTVTRAKASDYLRAAMGTTTDINGGLMATALLRMKDAANNINGGMSGLPDNIGFWTGGTYEQALADAATAFKAAKQTGALDRKDGAGHRAKGKFAWDLLGNLAVGIFEVREDRIVVNGENGNIVITNKTIGEVKSNSQTYNGSYSNSMTGTISSPINLSNYIFCESTANNATESEFKITVNYDLNAGISATTNSVRASIISKLRIMPTIQLIDASDNVLIESVLGIMNLEATAAGLDGAGEDYAADNSQVVFNAVIPTGLFRVRLVFIEVTNTNTGNGTRYSNCGIDADISFTAISTQKETIIGNDGLYVRLDSNNELLIKRNNTTGKIEMSTKGAALDIPAGLGGASINSSGTVVSWWGKITAANKVVKSGSNYTITHDIGDTDYSLILTPKSTNVPYFLDANRGANTVVVTCAGGFDFVLIRTK